MFFSQNVYKNIFNTQVLNFFGIMRLIAIEWLCKNMIWGFKFKRIWGLILLEKDSAKLKSLAHVPIEEL